MVLVGLVAALGVTIPTPTQCSQWWSSVRDVGSAVLADWDHWKPREKNEVQSVLQLPAVIALQRPAVIPVRHKPSQPVVSPRRTVEPYESRMHLIAAHHVRLPKTDDVEVKASSETWPDLPSNVFQTRPIVFEPMVISGDLNGGVAYDLNRMAEGIGIKAPTGGRAQSTTGPAKVTGTLAGLPSKYEPLAISGDLNGGVAYDLNRMAEGIGIKAPSRSGAQSSTGPAKAAGALPGLASKIKKKPAVVRHTVVAQPGIAPFSRIDNLEAGLWAGLIQSAEHTLAEDTAASPSTPSLPRLSAHVESMLSGGPHTPLVLSIDFDGWDLIDADSAATVRSDRAIADEVDGSIRISGSVNGFESGESLELLPWAEAMAFDRRDSEPSVTRTHPSKTTGTASVFEPEISSDLKQAISLTKDALNAWMNLVRRGSSFQITKR